MAHSLLHTVYKTDNLYIRNPDEHNSIARIRITIHLVGESD